MDTQIIFIYCLCDEFLNAIGLKDHPQAKMTNAEIMTFALTAALYFKGNYAVTHLFFSSHNYLDLLRLSRLNKRLLRIPEEIWLYILSFSHVCLCESSNREFIVDSFPVPVCANARITRCKLVHGKKYHGYCASKKMYFFGIKVHVVTTAEGIPVEVLFTPGSESDIRAFRRFHLDLPEGAIIYADKAYTDYSYEDLLAEVGINLCAHRKKNATRQHSYQLSHIQKYRRKRIETTFSSIANKMPRSIHAVTIKGFLLKVMLFIITHSLQEFEL